VEESVPNEIPLKTFLDHGGTSVDWLVNGVLAAGTIAMMAADSRLGKTSLLTQVSLCLAVGISPFEGWGVKKKRKTLYLIAEGSRTAFRSRVDAARIAKNVPREAGWFVQREGFTDYQIGARGLESIVASSKAELVVLDTMRYFYQGDENSSDDWMRHVMLPLRILTEKHGCTFILVHHLRKGTTLEDDALGRIRGTSAMGADLDAVFLLDQEADDPTGRVLTMGKQKYGVEDQWQLRFDAENARFG
jgi:RecA-family ATPase